jgi:hypothetical protein
MGAEIFAEEKVLRRATAVDVGTGSEAQKSEEWQDFLEKLGPGAFGKYKM